MLNEGQLVTGLAAVEDDEFAAEAPAATFDGILGLFLVTKLPQIWRNAKARSGPMFGAAGPKSKVTDVSHCPTIL
jgi:hypothetical protein